MAAQLVVTPVRAPLVGSIPIPSDHRVALTRIALGALGRGHTSLSLRGMQRSVRVFLDFLHLVGVESSYDGKVLRVSGLGLFSANAPSSAIDLRGELHVAALALAFLVSRPFPSELLVDRAVADLLVPALSEAHPIGSEDVAGGGVRLVLEKVDEGVRPEGLSVVTGGIFSWVKEAVLLAGLRAQSPTVVEEKLASSDHLERAMIRARMPLDVQGTVAVLHPPRDEDAVAPQTYEELGSAALAPYLCVAAAGIPHSRLTLRDVNLNPTRSDYLSVVRLFGASTGMSPRGDRQNEPFGDVSVQPGPLRPLDVAGETSVRLGDSVLALLAMAARTPGKSTFSDLVPQGRGGDERIYGRAVGLLRSCGVGAELVGGSLVVDGVGEGHFRPLVATTGGDGRLALLGTVLALFAKEPSVIDDVDCLGEEFPRWVGSLRALGAQIEVKTSE